METPPRAWGRRRPDPRISGPRGNTPTCVGKTIERCSSFSPGKKHPHVRGEDSAHNAILRRDAETPPRAWGRLTNLHRGGLSRRNTPTCVGKTVCYLGHLSARGKHPHVRGEDWARLSRYTCNTETPPRAWGRQNHTQWLSAMAGNTPTCVGKTKRHIERVAAQEKHPHVRGEDAQPSACCLKGKETPPRAWGRHAITDEAAKLRRNTPTCVGKTATASALKFSKHYR